MDGQPSNSSSTSQHAQQQRRIAALRDGYNRGWSFTPLGGQDGKRPILKAWQSQSRESVDQALQWAEVGNVGLRTGSNSGIVVIDIESEPKLTPTERDLYLSLLPPTVTAISGRDGRHLYYKHPQQGHGCSAKDVRLSLNAKKGVDVKGDGGQVVFVGSVNLETGGEYRWMPGRSPDEIDLADFPADVLNGVNLVQAAALRMADEGQSHRTIAASLFVNSGTISRWLTDQSGARGARAARSHPDSDAENDGAAARTARSARTAAHRAQRPPDFQVKNEGAAETGARGARSAARGARGAQPEDPLYNSWVKTALESEISAVLRTPEGERNNTLNTAAFSLGQLVGGGHLSRQNVEQALMSASSGWDNTAAWRQRSLNTITSGINAGMQQPRQYTPRSVPAMPPPPRMPPPAGVKPAPATPPSYAHAHVSDTPTVTLGTDQYRVVEETIAALTADASIYSRGRILCRIAKSNAKYGNDVFKPNLPDGTGSSFIEALPQASLNEQMTRYAEFVKRTQKDGEWIEVPCIPPDWLVKMIHHRGEWPGFRELLAISDSPVLRKDGSIHQTPGYDPETRVLYEPSSSEIAAINIDPGVGLDDAQAAVDALNEVIVDFPFDSEADKSAWLAALLTPLARSAFAGCSPLFLFDANSAGAGKSKLVQACSNIVSGGDLGANSYTDNTEEMRKSITALAISGERMFFLDNIENNFGNDVIDRALTATVWKDRILGQSAQVTIPLLVTWYATGNNVSVSADTARRIIHCRIDVREEKPQDRSNFRHRDLIGWIRANRPRLLASALTILSAYIRNGMPSQGLSEYGSFEGWSSLIRSAIVWAGLPDPCLTRDRLTELSDSTMEKLAHLIDAFKLHNAPIAVSETVAHLYQEGSFRPNNAAAISLRAAFEEITGVPPGRTPTAAQIGNRLKKYRGKVHGGYRIVLDAAYSRTKHGRVWSLEKIEE